MQGKGEGMNPEEAIQKVEAFVEFTTGYNVPKPSRLVQGRKELKELAKILASLKPKNFALEIGLAHGGSHFFWRLFFEKVISIEWGQEHYDISVRRLTAYGCDMSKSVLIFGDSTEQPIVDEVKKHLGVQKLDFLFIDGGHTWNVVYSDFKNYWRLVRKGGVIAMHDTGDGKNISTATSGYAVLMNQMAAEYGITPQTFISIDHCGISWCRKL